MTDLAGTHRILIAVPLYRSPELIEDLFASLVAMTDEILGLSATLLLINDSPDDETLVAALDRHLPALRAAMDVELIMNNDNLGFVRTANRAFALGLERHADILLLNSDARPRPGAFAEMTAVATLDPMIGFVSPRSDNATLCDSPYPPAWRAGSPDESYAHHKALERYLPRYSYAPTAVGFCLYVRRAMIEEFGVFDEIYEGGYNEENDLIRRCNRRGYRAVLANHAYVHHLGGASFAVSAMPTTQREERNRAILIDRYPEYSLSVQRFYDGADHRAQRLLAGLVPLGSAKPRILFDCRTLECSHKGTFEHSRRLLAALAPLAAARFDLFVLCERAAFEFHGLDNVRDLHFCEQNDVHDRPFAIAMRLVQPFLLEDIVTLADYAPVTGFLVLDTIAMDCQQLDTHGLDALWRFMVEAVSLIGYNSEFTRDQFNRRIDVPSRVTEFVSRCSTDVSDYATPDDLDIPNDRILVVGNDYPHKHVAETIAAIRAARPDAGIDALGGSYEEPQGSIDDEQVDALYHRAGVVVFPSHYEGFGLPILHGLARHKSVVARDLPSAREIADRVAGALNLHLAASTSAIVDLVMQQPRWRLPDTKIGGAGWADAATALLDAFESALQRFDFETCRRQQAAILGHRARLDAERRYHEGAAQSADLRTEIDVANARIATDEKHRRELEQALADTHLAEERAERRATEMEAHRNTAQREAALAARRADQARWDASQAIARDWKAARSAEDSGTLLAILADAPSYPMPAWYPAQTSATGRFTEWLSNWPGRPVIRARLGEFVPAPTSKAIDRLDLTFPAGHAHPAELIALVLEWIDLLAVGAHVRLIMDGATAEQDATGLMQASGCLPTKVSRSTKHLRLTGLKLWEARWPLAAPDEDPIFLRAAYRIILHREPDPEGAARYLTDMEGGMSRDAIIRSLLTSRERFDMILARLKGRDRTQR